MKLKSLVELVVWLIGIALTDVLSFTLKDTVPLAGGMLAGMSVYLILGMVAERKYGRVPVEAVIPKSVVLKLGLWPIAVLVLLAVFFIYVLPQAPFLLGFLETLTTAACFMFATLAIIVRNSEREDRN